MVTIISKHSVLISTLGTEPQVVTATLDLLLQMREDVQHVVVLHTEAPGTLIAEAVSALEEDFSHSTYDPKIILKLQPIKEANGKPLFDVETMSAMQDAFREIYQQVHKAKQADQKIHFCIAGGRKPLAVYGMTVAQMLFDEDDCLWYLYSSGEYLESKRLHPQPGDEVGLVQIPVILWSHISPVFTDLGEIGDPNRAIDRIRELQLTEKVEMARTYLLGSLTHAERRVIDLLVQTGDSDTDLAEKLSISYRTVEQHLGSAYRKAAAHWNLGSVHRTQLVSLLRFYYSINSEEEAH